MAGHHFYLTVAFLLRAPVLYIPFLFLLTSLHKLEMGRKLFIRHYEEVVSAPPPRISAVHSPDEAMTAFTFCHTQEGRSRSCNMKILAQDVDEYPDGNTYILFTDDENADPGLVQKFDIIASQLPGKPLLDALTAVSRALAATAECGNTESPVAVNASDDEDMQEEDAGDGFTDYNSDDDTFGLNNSQPIAGAESAAAS